MEITSSPKTSVLAAPRNGVCSSLAIWSPLLVAGIIVLYLGTTGAMPLLGKDEPRYVEVAREMWMRGDWVTPTLGGAAWFEKPALLYWLIMASFSLLGVSEWAARLGPALCGLAAIGLVCRVAREAERKSTRPATGLAWWSALALASSVGLTAFSHGATFDIVLTATVTLSLAGFYIAELETVPQKRSRALAALWGGVGLALLAKGLVGIILPGGVILLYFALRRDWRGIARLRLHWGIPLALAVAGLWYGPVIARHGQPFINVFFIQHHFARYLSNKYQHPQPLYYYLPVMAVLALPWTAFLLSALRGAGLRAGREDDAQSKLRVLALAWLIVPVAFFSLSGSKLSGYVLPALPGAMLLVGLGVAAFVRGESGFGQARATGVLLLFLGGGVAITGFQSGAMAISGIAPVALPLAGAGLACLFAPQRRALCAGLTGVAMLFSTGLLAGVAGVPLSEGQSVRLMMRTASAHGYRQEAVWQMKTIQRSAEFYAAGRVLYRADGEPRRFEKAAEIAQALPPGGQVLVLVPLRKARRLSQSPLLHTERVADNGDIALFAVRAASPGWRNAAGKAVGHE